ncbi:hypothetical protein [Vibrio rotiferianus]|uniref:hypothetical protein n=1 Tax=Vibrio rotiferianus TaxID=190895 RepID=UPI002896215F|nr:hypothetical protein THOE12_120103 [Vibrio rotiferianus]
MTRDMTNYNMRWIEDDPMPVEDKAPISAREKIERQRRQLHKEREVEWNYILNNEARYLAHSTKIIEKRNLESEIHKATEELLIFLPALNLESSVHRKAVKEFSETFDVILKGYNQENITYDVGYDLIHQIKNGFIEGGRGSKKT